jgi:hypothetical protein
VHDVAPVLFNTSVTDPAPHTEHATVDAALYCPATHAVQRTPPVMFSVSVTEPAPHTTHCVCPANACTRPAGHATHGDNALLRPYMIAKTTSSSYCPAAHTTHPPPLAFAYVPLGQAAQSMVDVLVYCPTGHAVQVVAPAACRVSVTDPAGHTRHTDVDPALLYCPATHAEHIVTPDT